MGSWYENTIFHLNNRPTHGFSFHFLWSNVKWFSENEVIKDDKFNNMLVTISFPMKTIYNWINQIRINSQIEFLKKITNIDGRLNTNKDFFLMHFCCWQDDTIHADKSLYSHCGPSEKSESCFSKLETIQEYLILKIEN